MKKKAQDREVKQAMVCCVGTLKQKLREQVVVAWRGFMLSSHVARTYSWLWAIRKKYWGKFIKIPYTVLVLKLYHSPAPHTLGFPSRQGNANGISKAEVQPWWSKSNCLISGGIAKASGLNCKQLMSMKVLCILPFHHTVQGTWLVYSGSWNPDWEC